MQEQIIALKSKLSETENLSDKINVLKEENLAKELELRSKESKLVSEESFSMVLRLKCVCAVLRV